MTVFWLNILNAFFSFHHSRSMALQSLLIINAIKRRAIMSDFQCVLHWLRLQKQKSLILTESPLLWEAYLQSDVYNFKRLPRVSIEVWMLLILFVKTKVIWGFAITSTCLNLTLERSLVIDTNEPRCSQISYRPP